MQKDNSFVSDVLDLGLGKVSLGPSARILGRL